MQVVVGGTPPTAESATGIQAKIFNGLKMKGAAVSATKKSKGMHLGFSFSWGADLKSIGKLPVLKRTSPKTVFRRYSYTI